MSRLSEVQATEIETQGPSTAHRASGDAALGMTVRVMIQNRMDLREAGKCLTACLLHNEPASYSCQQG